MNLDDQFTQGLIEEQQGKEWYEDDQDREMAFREEEYCPACHNSGYLSVGEFDSKPCPACTPDFPLVVPCTTCNGYGVVPDALDKGNVLTCAMCEGKKYIPEPHDTERPVIF